MGKRLAYIGIAVTVLLVGTAFAITGFGFNALPGAVAADPQVAAKDPGLLTPYLRFSGSGTVSVRPDSATITAGATGRGKTSQEAMTEAQSRLRGLVTALEKASSGAAIATEPVSTYQDDKQQWIAVASVTVSGLPPARAADVLQAATDAQADQISGPFFGLDQTGDAEAEALRKALTAARAKADVVAAAMGVRVTGIVSVDETISGGPIPMRDVASDSMMKSVPPVVLPGTIDVAVSVTVTFAYTA